MSFAALLFLESDFTDSRIAYVSFCLFFLFCLSYDLFHIIDVLTGRETHATNVALNKHDGIFICAICRGASCMQL